MQSSVSSPPLTLCVLLVDYLSIDCCDNLSIAVRAFLGIWVAKRPGELRHRIAAVLGGVEDDWRSKALVRRLDGVRTNQTAREWLRNVRVMMAPIRCIQPVTATDLGYLLRMYASDHRVTRVHPILLLRICGGYRRNGECRCSAYVNCMTDILQESSIQTPTALSRIEYYTLAFSTDGAFSTIKICAESPGVFRAIQRTWSNSVRSSTKHRAISEQCCLRLIGALYLKYESVAFTYEWRVLE